MKFQGFETKKNVKRCTFYEGLGGHVGNVCASRGGKGWQFVPQRVKAQHGVLFTTMKHLLQSPYHNVFEIGLKYEYSHETKINNFFPFPISCHDSIRNFKEFHKR